MLVFTSRLSVSKQGGRSAELLVMYTLMGAGRWPGFLCQQIETNSPVLYKTFIPLYYNSSYFNFMIISKIYQSPTFF